MSEITVSVVGSDSINPSVGNGDAVNVTITTTGGDRGPTGQTGPANKLSIGTVEGGTTAAATITGTAPTQTLNLVLPRGQDAPQNGVTYEVLVGDAYKGIFDDALTYAEGDVTLDIGSLWVRTSNSWTPWYPTPASHLHSSYDITDFSTAVAAAAPVTSVNGQTGAVSLDLSGGGGSYTLPAASDITLGGVKVGANISVTGDGTISVSAPVTTLAATAVTGLATVATSGKYSDLTGAPTTFTASQISDRATSLVTSVNGQTGDVTVSGGTGGGSYTLPTATASILGGVKVGTGLSISSAVLAADVTTVAGRTGAVTLSASDVSGLATVATSGQYSDLSSVPTTFAPSAHSHAVSEVTGLQTALDAKAASSTLATVATSGKYSDLSGTPSAYTLPAATSVDLGGVKVGSNVNVSVDGTISVAAPVTTLAATSVTGLATVATSGKYSDLSGTPSAYTLPNATTTTLGGVIIGSGLSVSSGTVSASVTSVAGRTGAVTIGSGDVSGLATSATTDTTSATNITSGTLPAARLPSTAVVAGSYGSASSAGTFTVDATGRLTAAGATAIAIASSAVSGLAASATTDTTSATNITSGTLPAARLPSTTVVAGSYGTASSVGTFTVDSAGRLTAAGSTAIAIASSAVSGLATSATTDTTSATNITSGTLPAARLPSATASVIGGVIVGGGLSVSSGTVSADLRSNTSGITGANAITNIVYMTSAAYTALATKSATTLYIISG